MGDYMDDRHIRRSLQAANNIGAKPSRGLQGKGRDHHGVERAPAHGILRSFDGAGVADRGVHDASHPSQNLLGSRRLSSGRGVGLALGPADEVSGLRHRYYQPELRFGIFIDQCLNGAH